MLIQNKQTLLDKFKEDMFQNSDNMFLYDKFRVDCLDDKDEYLYIHGMFNLLNSDNCDLAGYIQDKILGKRCERKPLCEVTKDYRHTHKKEHCSDSEIIKDCCQISNIGEVEW